MTDIALHIVDTGPKITTWSATTAYIVGNRVLTATGKRLYECITAGTSGASEPTGELADVTDGSAHWHYLCTQDYVGLAELTADYNAGTLSLDLVGSLEKHLIWVWDNGSTYSKWGMVFWTTIHSSLYHTEFSAPGPNNIPTDFVGAWDLAVGDSFVEQMATGALNADVNSGTSIAAFTHNFRAYYQILERVQVLNNINDPVIQWGKNTTALRNVIAENTATSRFTNTWNAAFRAVGDQVENCVFVDHCSSAGSYVFSDVNAGLTNCTVVSPSDITPDPTMILWGDVYNPATLNCTIMGWSNLTNPFPDEPAAPSGWTWTNLVTDMPTAVFAAGTLTNCKTGEPALTATNVFVQAATTGVLDFNLAAGSAPIDAGTTGGPADDIFGTTRDASPDIGAVEYVAAGGVAGLKSPGGMIVNVNRLLNM